MQEYSHNSGTNGSGGGERFRPPDHPLRDRIAAEVHARPFESMAGPLRISHLAVKSGEKHAQAVCDHLARLCEPFGVTPSPMDAEFFRAGIAGPVAATLGDAVVSAALPAARRHVQLEKNKIPA